MLDAGILWYNSLPLQCALNLEKIIESYIGKSKNIPFKKEKVVPVL